MKLDKPQISEYRFVTKAVQLVDRLFPQVYANRPKRGSYHWALAFERNKLIAVGVNKPEKVNAKALAFARKFRLREKILYPMIHAEEDLLSRLIGLERISPSLNIVVLRRNKWGEFGNSAPCNNCKVILRAFGLDRVYYSTSDGEIVRDEN